ncbi:hypothetical protein [Sporomusa aerivorans]|uniref:hypothetical protein n=1 Tax=Sporomusa aerivorans TaxID=204936 RepID=UPI00352B840C
MPQNRGKKNFPSSLAGIVSLIALAAGFIKIASQLPRLRLLPAFRFVMQFRLLSDYFFVLFLTTLSPSLRHKVNSCLSADR